MALLAGCGGRAPRKLAGSAADIPILRDRLDVERFEIALLEVSLDRLDGDALTLARIALKHDREHAQTLAEAIRELGGSPSPKGGVAIQEVPHPIDQPLAEIVSLKARVALEYASAIPKLVNPRLRGTFGALMTTEAEHAAALDGAR